MTTLANKHIAERPLLTPTTQRKAAPWGYFLYCEVLKIFRDPAAVITTVAFPAVIFMIVGLRLPGLASTILPISRCLGFPHQVGASLSPDSCCVAQYFQ